MSKYGNMDENKLDALDRLDSKLYLTSKNKQNVTKFKSKTKRHLSPINSSNKNGPQPPKKIKFTDNNASRYDKKPQPKINIQEQRSKLPAFIHRRALIDHIKRNKNLVILGETGCGKTTQIPQFIYNAKLNNNGKIGITQPRRVAAISLATRVAQEFGNGQSVGDIVGYTVRFEDCTSDKTKIKFLTDGMLLREAMFDKLLKNYSVIILDEAHERTIHTDVLFGVVKNAQKIREIRNMPPLKIVIMSATMDVDHFAGYFNNCPVVYIEGRQYPVEVFFAVKRQEDYATACVATFFKIHQEAPANHGVLIFLTGQEEIETAVHQIRVLACDPDVQGPPVEVCPLYAAQPSTQQMAVFRPPPENTRKVIVSTNIAETSVTISGIKYIIDSGMVKARTYHPATGLEVLKVQRTSQEQAWQRTGRAGRESDGSCYRVYTRSEFEMMQKSSTPEIQRANLSSVVLELLSLNIHPLSFDFLDKPPQETILAAFEQLKMLGAIESATSTQLAQLGRQMVKFPVDPRFSKMLLSAQKFGCVSEILTVVSLLSVESILYNPPSKREEAQNARAHFRSSDSDHLTLLNIFREFSNVGHKKVRSWCREHFIHQKNILQAKEIRNQLKEICINCKIKVISCGEDTDRVRKCLLTGLFMNVAELQQRDIYVTLDKKTVVSIHPSSELHARKCNFVLFTEVVQTSKSYLRLLTAIESEWLYEIAPDYMKTHTIRATRNTG